MCEIISIPLFLIYLPYTLPGWKNNNILGKVCILLGWIRIAFKKNVPMFGLFLNDTIISQNSILLIVIICRYVGYKLLIIFLSFKVVGTNIILSSFKPKYVKIKFKKLIYYSLNARYTYFMNKKLWPRNVYKSIKKCKYYIHS